MNELIRGLLKNDTPYTIRILHLDDLDEVLSIQEEVVAVLENESVLATLSIEEFQYILSGNGMLIGVFVDESLIAFRATLVPGEDEEHLGLDIGLDSSELSQVIYQEISSVSPKYRGHGLQQVMAKVLMSQLMESDFTYVCATVAPFNIPSLKDKFSQRMEVAAMKEKYGGKLRYVFVKNLKENGKVYEDELLIPMNDTAKQQKALLDGWRGTNLIEDSNGWSISYEK